MACLPAMLTRRSLRFWALAAFAVSFAALALAYTSEIVFDLRPCTMCYWQRIPFAVILVLALLAYFVPQAKVKRGLLWLCVATLAGGAALAAFHAGVEWRWWEGPSGCSGGINGALTTEQILAQIKGAAIVSCTDAAVRVLGLSMAGWNALYSVGAAVVIACGLRHAKQEI